MNSTIITLIRAEGVHQRCACWWPIKQSFWWNGTQLESWNPNPVVWEEFGNITDFLYITSCGTVQSCGHTMALTVVGERSLWLNLSSIGDREKLDYLNAPVDSLRQLGKDVIFKRKKVRLLCLLATKENTTPSCSGPCLQCRTGDFWTRLGLQNPRVQSIWPLPQLLQVLVNLGIKRQSKSRSTRPSNKKKRDT